MRNVQTTEGAENCVYDIFQFTEVQFKVIFPNGTDVAFIGEVEKNASPDLLEKAFEGVWERRIPKSEVRGSHGTLFYELEFKKDYYPTRRDEEAANPNGTRLR